MSARCDALREATRGCRVVIMAATDFEAEPLRAALTGAERHEIATKTIYVGEVRGAGPGNVREVLAVTGCDKVNVALVLTSLLQAMSPAPELVLQVGIAGGFAAPGAGPRARPGDLVVATQEAYSDTGGSSPTGWISAKELGLPIAQVEGVETGGVFRLDATLVEWAVGALMAADLRVRDGAPEAPAVLAGPCVTSSLVTGTDAEARALAERWGALAESMEGAAAAHVCALCDVPFLELRAISNVVGDRDRSKWVVEQAVDVAGRAALALLGALAVKAVGPHV